MKAIQFQKYGAPEKVLKLVELPKPVPGKNQVLLKVKASAINDYDWALTRGKPILYRLMFGLFNPKSNVPGMEVSGIVEEVGSDVKKLKTGDAVFGDTSESSFGSFAEFMCVHEDALVRKPDEISFEEAVTLPHASLLALQGLREQGKISEGDKVLINGGGGGVGTIGLQLAKLFNCEVTGVDSGEKLDLMKSIGFDYVLDYRTINFIKTGKKYDLILDCKTSRPALSYLKALKPGGRYVTVGGRLRGILGLFIWGKIMNLISSKKLKVLALKTNQGLEYIADLYKQGKLKSIIDGPYPLENVPELVQYFGEGRHKGKIVIKIN
jgi:NADPH:quinone reductase-like Zn-dependent oxidoreductase